MGIADQRTLDKVIFFYCHFNINISLDKYFCFVSDAIALTSKQHTAQNENMFELKNAPITLLSLNDYKGLRR